MQEQAPAGDIVNPHVQEHIPAQEVSIGVLPVLGYDALEPKEEAILLCARIIHESVKAINDALGEPTLPWEDNKVSVIAGINRTLANPGETSEANHEAWMAYKISEGWVYGTVKDPVKKTHPCLVPFAELSPMDRSKDAVFHAIIRTLFGVK